MSHTSALFYILLGLFASACIRPSIVLEDTSTGEVASPNLIHLAEEEYQSTPFSGTDNLHIFVSFLVDETGKVANPVVTQNTNEVVKQQAIQALESIRFMPVRETNLLNAEMTLPVLFRGQKNLPNLSDFLDRVPILLGTLEDLVQEIEYPERARRANLEGKVTIAFIIDESGHVQFPTVTQRLGAGCDEEALHAVTRMRFVPGQLDGTPVNVMTSMTFVFKLT